MGCEDGRWKELDEDYVQLAVLKLRVQQPGVEFRGLIIV
jgi:hypothetical protein